MSKARATWLDFAKGVGILLVVAGHLVAGEGAVGHDWVEVWKGRLYAFHMPFFMLISGYIATQFYRPVVGVEAYWSFVWKRFQRLMVPFLLLAACVYFGKQIAAQSGRVDNPVGPDTHFWDVLVKPRASYCRFVWYVYALFLFGLPHPFIMRSLRGHAWLTALSLLALGFLWLGGGISSLNNFWQMVVANYPFFLWGGYLARKPSVEAGHTKLFWLWGLGLLAAFLAAHLYSGWAFFAGLCGAPLWFVLCRKWHDWLAPEGRWRRWLSYVGVYAFPIYLFNTIAIGLGKMLLWKAFDWHGPRFWIYLPWLMAWGCLVPLLAQRYLIEKVPLLNRLLPK
jgi:uncharacterized membrane protein YcfT